MSNTEKRPRTAQDIDDDYRAICIRLGDITAKRKIFDQHETLLLREAMVLDAEMTALRQRQEAKQAQAHVPMSTEDEE